MQHKLLFSLLAAAFLLPTVCQADILLCQDPDTAEFAFADHDFTDVPTISSYMVDDITLASSTGQGYVIDSVSTYFRASSGDLSGVTTGVLSIFSDDGVLDTETPAGQAVQITVSPMADQGNGPNFVVTASGLNLCLDDGNYWIGLTPSMDSSTAQTQHWMTTAGSISGQQAHWINPGGGFGLGSDWNTSEIFGEGAYDMGLKVEGTEKAVPEPTSALILTAGLIGLVSRRRR